MPYADYAGNRITRKAWEKLRKETTEPGHKYETDRWVVWIEYRGFEPDTARPQQFWRIFYIHFQNKLPDGKLVTDPNLSCWAPDLKAALQRHTDILIKMGEARWFDVELEDGTKDTELVIGKENVLAREKELRCRNAPMTENEAAGSW